MEAGGVDVSGRKRSRDSSTNCKSSSKKSGRFIAGCARCPGTDERSRCFGLTFRFKWLGDDAPVSFLQQDFDFSFRLFELLLALSRERYAFFKQFHRVVQRELRAFQFSHYFFQPRERALEVGLLRQFSFLGSRCIHFVPCALARNSLRQGGETTQVNRTASVV